MSHETLLRARALGVAAVVVGGFDDRDLRQLLGSDLGVAITGSEELGLTLVLTEGFGRIRMADRTWRLLDRARGRAGVGERRDADPRRRHAPRDPDPRGRRPARRSRHERAGAGLEIGSLLRVIREPYFGRIGQVVELPPELQKLDTEAKVRVLVVEFADDGDRARRAARERRADRQLERHVDPARCAVPNH